MARLKEHYQEKIVPALMEEFSYKCIMQVPKVEKVVVNMGIGEAIQNIKILENAVEEMSMIVGQRPVITKARKSIASFKVREGMPIGCMVTLRGARMYEFLDRLLNVALPRIRDFRGISPNAFDGRGNFSMGLKEHYIFPEIDYDKIDRVLGMNISIVTTAKSDEEARTLLRLLGIAFKK